MMDREQREKLRVLLDYWIKHNEEHGEEFREWAEKAGGAGRAGVRDDLTQACEGMNSVNDLLRRALGKLDNMD